MKRNTVLSILMILIIFGVTVVFFKFENYTLSNQIDELNSTDKSYKNRLQQFANKILDLDKTVSDNDFQVLKDREGTVSAETLLSLDLKNYNKIMISTHPDDETFWGGGHLIEDNYLVVCVTCGMDDNRQKEFESIMRQTNDEYLMLSYPKSVDTSLVREFDWRAASYLTRDIQNILSLKDWDMIVTHNPSGEYGHKYHKLTSQIVTSLVKDKEKLYYFGKYYNKENADLISTDTLDDDLYNKKMDIINSTYLSQKGSVQNHIQMLKNENFIKYSDWEDDLGE